MMSKINIIIFFLTLYLATIVNAEEDHHHHDEDHEFEEHASHVHGHATANATYESDVLNIELSFSSVDIFGFEHAPKNEKQHKKIAQSIAILEKANNLFQFKKNNACVIDTVDISSEIVESDANAHHEHEEHGHDDENNEETHSDVTANYSFKCSENALESIEFIMFDHFPTLEKIEVQFISDKHQALFNALNNNRVQSIK